LSAEPAGLVPIVGTGGVAGIDGTLATPGRAALMRIGAFIGVQT
jgi:hypothetical protein